MTILKQQTNTRTPLENAMSIMSTVSMDQSIKYNQRHGICFKGLRHFLFSSYGFFGFSNFSKCPYSLVSKYHESMFGAQLRLTVPPDLTWNILQTSKSSKVEHSFLNCRGHITAHSGNSKFQCNLVVAGHGLLLFSCCQDLMQTNCRNFLGRTL